MAAQILVLQVGNYNQSCLACTPRHSSLEMNYLRSFQSDHSLS